MRTTTMTIATLAVMIALIVGVDITFLRNHFALRLMVNVGIVLLFVTSYVVTRRR